MLDDTQIIDIYLNGNREALNILIERYKTALYRFCYHLTSNKQEADDLFQDTWVKAVEKIRQYDNSRAFNVWLFSIAMNNYRDKYRKAKRWLSKLTDVFGENIQSEEPTAAEHVEGKEVKDLLVKCINELKDSYRIPLILYYYKEISYEDIAKILDIPLGTVKSRLNSAKKKLKEIMEVKGIE